jgi:hypothetical protein
VLRPCFLQMPMTVNSVFDPFELSPRGNLPPEWIDWLGHALCIDYAPPAPDHQLLDGWRAVLPALDVHAVTPLLYLRLRDARLLSALPQEFRDALYAAFQDNALRSLVFERELEDIVATFAREGIPLTVLKGLATGRLVYDSPAERPIGDLDLLVPFDAMTRARRTLRQIGYESIGWAGLDRVARWQHAFRSEMPMLCTRPDRYGLVTELHWSLLEIPYYIQRINMAEVWDDSAPMPGHDSIHVPDSATLLIHSAAHLALHHSRELRLIWLLDLDRLARWQAMDWAEVIAKTEAWGLGRAVYTALNVSRSWLASPIPPHVEERLLQHMDEAEGNATWGLGDERAGRSRRRAMVSWQLLDRRNRLRYAAWLGFRLLLRPFELSSRPDKRSNMEVH